MHMRVHVRHRIDDTIDGECMASPILNAAQSAVDFHVRGPGDTDEGSDSMAWHCSRRIQGR